MKYVDDFLKNQSAVALYREGIELLERSGLFNVLSRMGLPQIIEGGRDVNVQATQAAYSNGWHKALLHVRELEEMYRVSGDTSTVTPDYGAEQFLKERKFI